MGTKEDQPYLDYMVLIVFLGIKNEHYSTSNSNDHSLNDRLYWVNSGMRPKTHSSCHFLTETNLYSSPTYADLQLLASSFGQGFKIKKPHH